MCRNRVRIVVVGVLVLGPWGCRRFIGSGDSFIPFTKVTDRQSVGTEVTSLQVATLVGEIRVIGGTEDEVRVKASVKIKKARANKEAQTGEFADHVRLQIQDGKLTVADAHMDQPDKDDWHVSLVVQAPARLAARVSATAGRIQVDGMAADLDLSNDAGEIVVSGESIGSLSAHTRAGSIDVRAGTIGGPVEATASVGNVAVEVTKVPPTNDVRLGAETGNVVLGLPEASPGTFRAKTDVGNVDISGREGITVTRSGLGATAAGTIEEGGPTYDLSVKVGAVTVR